MLQSMTGFGKSSSSFGEMKVTVEIRTLNSKNFDLYLKIPNYFKEKEVVIRKILGDNLHRGKVEAIITVENNGAISDYDINTDLAAKYYRSLEKVANEVNAPKEGLLAQVARMPDVLVSKENELKEEDWKGLEKLLNEALENLIAFRRQEGDSLKKDFENRIDTIQELLDEVPKFEKERVDRVRERMDSSMNENNFEKDDNRFEQELIFYIEKLDVSEEKVRLQNHLSYFKETMSQGSPLGKKLGFIAQEINREVNTLGSKANHAELQKIVVDMKDNLEKIKEQVLNTL